MPGTVVPALARPQAPIKVNRLSTATLDWYRARGTAWLRANATVTWERPSESLHIFGLGTSVRLSGPRFEGIGEARRALEDLMDRFDTAGTGVAPIVFAGASFDPFGQKSDPAWDAFGGWQVLVPAITLIRHDDTWVGWACAGDFPPALPADTTQLARRIASDGLGHAIGTAVEEIRADRYQKVVLASSRTIELAPVTPPDVVARLTEAFPTCTVFSFHAAGLSWLGASPEPLAECLGGQVQLVSLAGSRRRGRDADEDTRLERELLMSEKERWEHRLVVDAITAECCGLVDGLEIDDQPAVMKLANIQHLCTRVRGNLAPGASLIELVERLHPTPAVGGWPRPAALDAIRRLENMDRGWYAGPFGWVDTSGNGQFVVGLRTALLGGGVARLYAGAGIVGDSIPAAELDEIETKLDALRGVISR